MPVINWMPRPQISCAQDVTEGMGVRTNSPLVEECRRGVMEFLLINHPLDCPICDQAGECEFQEFSVEYGNASSRFLENKVKKPKNVELGPRVTLDDERCILRSRCALDFAGERSRKTTCSALSIAAVTPCSPRIRASGWKIITRSTPSISVRSARSLRRISVSRCASGF